MFWGVELSEGQTHQIKERTDQYDLCVISNLAWVAGKTNLLINNQHIVTIDENRPNIKLNLQLQTSEKATLKLEGKGKVCLSGYFEIEDKDSDEEEVISTVPVSQLLQQGLKKGEKQNVDDVFNLAKQTIEKQLKKESKQLLLQNTGDEKIITRNDTKKSTSSPKQQPQSILKQDEKPQKNIQKQPEQVKVQKKESQPQPIKPKETKPEPKIVPKVQEVDRKPKWDELDWSDQEFQKMVFKKVKK